MGSARGSCLSQLVRTTTLLPPLHLPQIILNCSYSIINNISQFPLNRIFFFFIPNNIFHLFHTFLIKKYSMSMWILICSRHISFSFDFSITIFGLASFDPLLNSTKRLVNFNNVFQPLIFAEQRSWLWKRVKLHFAA